MTHPGILVIGETPSLGRSIVGLLESVGLPCRYSLDVSASGDSGLDGVEVVVVAANAHYCATLRAQQQGALGERELVVVGSRDPLGRAGPHVYPVELPLRPSDFLALIRSLMAAATQAQRSRSRQSNGPLHGSPRSAETSQPSGFPPRTRPHWSPQHAPVPSWALRRAISFAAGRATIVPAR